MEIAAERGTAKWEQIKNMQPINIVLWSRWLTGILSPREMYTNDNSLVFISAKSTESRIERDKYLLKEDGKKKSQEGNMNDWPP